MAAVATVIDRIVAVALSQSATVRAAAVAVLSIAEIALAAAIMLAATYQVVRLGGAVNSGFAAAHAREAAAARRVERRRAA